MLGKLAYFISLIGLTEFHTSVVLSLGSICRSSSAVCRVLFALLTRRKFSISKKTLHKTHTARGAGEKRVLTTL